MSFRCSGLALLALPTLAWGYSDEDKKRALEAWPVISFDEFDYPMGSFVTRANLEIMQGEVRPDDIFICSYPKSGTNWVKQIVNLVRLGADPGRLKEYEGIDLSDLIPYPEGLVSTFDWPSLEKIKPRAFFSHMQWKDTPKGAKYIYVVREFADAIQSMYPYMKGMGQFPNTTLDEAAQLMMEGILFSGAWEEHVAGFWEQRGNPDVLLMKFEDLKKDHAREVARIAKFMKADLATEQLARVVEMSTYKFMKAQGDKIQGKAWTEKLEVVTVAEDHTLFNKGESGKSGLKPEVADAVRNHFSRKSAPLLGNPASYADWDVQRVNNEKAEL